MGYIKRLDEDDLVERQPEIWNYVRLYSGTGNDYYEPAM
jgi:hypothetical protein